MTRGRALALAAYAILVASLGTGLSDPLTRGDDESWWLAVVLGGAHLGAALVVRRWWVLLLPLFPFVVAAIVGDALVLWLMAFAAAPALLVVVAVGWGGGRLVGDRAAIAGAVVLVVAAGPMVWAIVEQIDRAGAPKLSTVEQARLPVEESLGNLCPDASSPPSLQRRLRRETENLIAEIERRPDALVDYRWTDSHTGEDHHEEITVEELAEQQMRDFEEYDETDPEGRRCVPELRRRLRDAVENA